MILSLFTQAVWAGFANTNGVVVGEKKVLLAR